MNRLIRRALFVLLVCLALATAILPGPQHALWPSLAGLTRAAPGVWIDDPAQRDTAGPMMARALAGITAFHGPFEPPRVIICTQADCAKRLHIQTAGLSYGRHLIVLGPDGANDAVLGHELSHAALHQTYGVSALWRPPFPHWFDEGLAVHLSPDPRYHAPDSLAQAQWLLAAETLHDWKRLITQDNWPDAYGGAGYLVDHIAAHLGDGGLRDLVTRVQAGAEFGAELRRLGVDLTP